VKWSGGENRGWIVYDGGVTLKGSVIVYRSRQVLCIYKSFWGVQLLHSFVSSTITKQISILWQYSHYHLSSTNIHTHQHTHTNTRTPTHQLLPITTYHTRSRINTWSRNGSAILIIILAGISQPVPDLRLVKARTENEVVSAIQAFVRAD
jgi:hypothetical protein